MSRKVYRPMECFLSDVASTFDLSEMERSYERELRGKPPYHPGMMSGYCSTCDRDRPPVKVPERAAP